MRTLFAAPFENATADGQYDPIADGLGDLIGVMLAHKESIRLVERQRLGALAEEQALSLAGLTGDAYVLRAGMLLRADTVLTGRLFLIEGKLTVGVRAIDIASARVLAADQISCRPDDLPEAALQAARALAGRLALPLPEIDLSQVDTSPMASLHFAKALGHYHAGNLDPALMQFMRTLDLDPDYVEAHYWCGMCYSRLGESDHAVIELEGFLRRQPQSKYAEQARGELDRARQRLRVPASGTAASAPATRPSR